MKNNEVFIPKPHKLPDWFDPQKYPKLWKLECECLWKLRDKNQHYIIEEIDDYKKNLKIKEVYDVIKDDFQYYKKYPNTLIYSSIYGYKNMPDNWGGDELRETQLTECLKKGEIWKDPPGYGEYILS